MTRIAPSGRAKIRTRRPRAIGESDLSGFWYSLDEMVEVYQWAGNSLINTHLLVGPDEVDVPQDQFRTPILPADPIPRLNPRPGSYVTPISYRGRPGEPNAPLPTTPTNRGFSQYIIGGSMYGFPLDTQDGVLAEVLTQADVGAPDVWPYVVPMAQMIPEQLMFADTERTFLLLYNPAAFPVQFALGSTVSLGSLPNFSIGPGEAFFWYDAQGLGPAYRGAITALSAYGADCPIWVWVDGQFWNNGGVLSVLRASAFTAWPTDPTGLLPGAFWNNGGAIAVVPGSIPDPAAPPVFFGTFHQDDLLALGGANLPTLPGPFNSLWSNEGEVSIAKPFVVEFWNNGGVLTFLTAYAAAWYPTDPTGLAPGTYWNNGGAVAVVQGSIPDPAAPLVYFDKIGAAALQRMGGANLPLLSQDVDSLWNNGGEVSVSSGPMPFFMLDDSTLDGTDELA